MEEFFDIPTLIVIGLAIVVLFRLRQVLGTRTGRERTPAQRQADKEAMYAEAKRGGTNVRASSLAELMRGAPLPLEPEAA